MGKKSKLVEKDFGRVWETWELFGKFGGCNISGVDLDDLENLY